VTKKGLEEKLSGECRAEKEEKRNRKNKRQVEKEKGREVGCNLNPTTVRHCHCNY
jgi:hypothetical protein